MLNAEQIQALLPSSSSGLPKVRQLYLALYEAIITGELPDGMILPASRNLASILSIGRNTVISVYNQLCDEGLLHSDGRRGTRVSYSYQGQCTTTPTDSQWPLSARSASFNHAKQRPNVFSPGQPDTSLFSQAAWKRALQSASRLPTEQLGYQQNSLPQLQSALSRYLATYRSLRVQPQQIIITASTRQSLLLGATLFTNHGDTAWVESPGYSGAIDAFRHLGLKLHPCTIDQQGLVPLNTDQSPALIYTTPCFQYPRGMPLSAERRAQLLKRSREHGTVLFEDDYDSEFRDNTQPGPALAANDADAKVLHAGTFSKLMFPAVRVAWLVVPQSHADSAHACLRSLGGGHNTIAQAAVAELLDNGSVTRHLQRARSIYAQRRNVLVECLSNSRTLRMPATHAGSLNMVLSLVKPCHIGALEQALNQQGIGAVPLERMLWHKPLVRTSREIVIGLGNVESMDIPDKVDALEQAIQSL